MKGRWGVMAMGSEMADVQGVDGQGQGGQGGIMARGGRGVRRCVEGIARRPTGGRHALVTPTNALRGSRRVLPPISITA